MFAKTPPCGRVALETQQRIATRAARRTGAALHRNECLEFSASFLADAIFAAAEDA
jgi:hypothetical protein